MLIRYARSLLLLVTAVLMAGCAAAAVGAGAGAAAGIYLTSRGAKALVNGTVPDVTRRTEAVLAELGFTITKREYEDGGNKVELDAEGRDRTVDIDIERESATTTEVDVEVKKSAVEWDQDYSKMILERIVSRR